MNNKRMRTSRYAMSALWAVALWAIVCVSVAIATPPHPNTHVKNVTFVAFDVETTGLSPYQERVIEIGAVKFRNGVIIAEREWLIKPDRPIHPMAQRTHNISIDQLKDSPVFKDIYDEFIAFIDGSVLMAHNARFDVDFIREEMLRNDLPLPDAPVVDSLSLFRTWFPQAPSHAMEQLTEHLGVAGDVYHRALADAIYILDIFEIGLKRKDDNLPLRQLYRDAGGPMHFAPTKLASPRR